MAINKPTKPSVSLPDSFGGIKTPYTESQIESGYEDGIPQIVDGGNINYEKDAVFKNTKYLRTVADTLVDMPIGKLLTVDSNNRFEYMDKPDLSSYQLQSNLSQSLDTSTTKYPSNKAVKAVTDTKAKDSDVVHKTGNENIDGIKTFKQGIKGTFQNYYVYNGNDDSKLYCKVMKTTLTGSYQTVTIPFIMTSTNPTNGSSALGQIKLRVEGTAGIINEDVTNVSFPFLPEWALSGFDFKIIYKNNYPNSDQVLVEFWVKVSNIYNGVCFTILDEMAGGISKTRECSWYNNTERYAKLPSDYSVINFIYDALYVATPSSNSNNKRIANTEWTNSRITSIMNSKVISDSGSNWVKFGNGLLICWRQEVTLNKTITFPKAFKEEPTVIGVGFMVDGRGEQKISITSTNFTTTSNVNNCCTQSWLAIGTYA